MNKKRLGVMALVFGTFFLVIFKYSYPYVPVLKVVTILTRGAFILALLVEMAITKTRR